MIRDRLPHRADHAQTGSTLIEVLVTLLVLAIGIAPAFAVFPRSHANAGTAQNLQIASQLGTDSIEQLRATPWMTLRAGALRRAGSYPASPPVADRVAFSAGLPTAYTPAGKPAEPLVEAAAASGSQPLEYQEVAVDGRRFGVYRFASWRKESCPLISLSDLLGGVDITASLTTITGLQSRISSVNSAISTVTTNLTGRSSALNTLIGSSGSGGSLAALTTTANTALTSANSITGSLLSFVTTLLNNTTKSNIDNQLTNIAAIRTVLQGQQTTLGTIASELTAATAQLSTLGTSLSSLSSELTSLQSAVTAAAASGLVSGDLLDLCQLPDDFDLPDFDNLGSLTSKLSEAGTTLDGLGIDGSSTLSTLGTSLNSLSSSLTGLTSSQNTLSTKLSKLTSDVASANLLGGLLCVVLGNINPSCNAVKVDETAINANGALTYAGTISVPAALAGATSTLSDDSELFSSLIGTSSTGTTAGSGLKGLAGALLGAPPVGNTIRVSVAVIPLNAPSGVGPTKPVWISSVITNPAARLL